MTIKLIIGLRNPGSAYEQTRHNAGGWLVEALANQFKTGFKADKKLQAEIAMFSVESLSCRAVLPLTFMNHSGFPVRALSQFYRINAGEILVVHDELDLPAGRLKIKTGGGHGGHNGLRDIISQLGTAEFHRLRVGIGHPGHKDLVLNYVLGKPSIEDKQAINTAITRAIAATNIIVKGSINDAMNALNS